MTDKTGDSIHEKNSHYGEYTFHYWIWKNYINNIKTEWVGFCQYRKFFLDNKINSKNINFDELKEAVIQEVDNDNFDCILGDKFSVENYKISKILKNHFFEFLLNPSVILSKKKKNY